MTFMQKVVRDHPEITPTQVLFQKCPIDYGYESEVPKQCIDDFLDCAACWHREITNCGGEPEKIFRCEDEEIRR